jgi:hypothetical protein
MVRQDGHPAFFIPSLQARQERNEGGQMEFGHRSASLNSPSLKSTFDFIYDQPFYPELEAFCSFSFVTGMKLCLKVQLSLRTDVLHPNAVGPIGARKMVGLATPRCDVYRSMTS